MENVAKGMEALKSHMIEDYNRWSGMCAKHDVAAQSTWIKDKMIEEYCSGLRVEDNRKYWKITSTNGSGTQRSVSGFIVKAGDKKFLEGDMLKAAGWAAPARNFAR